MAPVTRRTAGQSGSGVNAPKVVHRKQQQRSTRTASHDTRAGSHAPSTTLGEDDEDDQMGNGYDSPSDGDEPPQMSIEGPYGFASSRAPAAGGSGSDNALLHPLRDLADKVGNEVETFAVALDRFVSGLPDADPFDAALELVEEFKLEAEKAVAELQKTHEKERDSQLKREWSERANWPKESTGRSLVFGKGSSLGVSLFGRKAESVKSLRQWEQEVDLWELFRLVLEIHYRPRDEAWQQEKERRLAELDTQTPHEFTPESTVWDRFLIEDDVAKERFLIKRWLEETADHQTSDLPGIVEELELKSGAGKGLWAKGWVNTREKIKAEKRLRTWPSASESIQPQIRRSDNNDLLVTMLDPDATARQQRTVEKPDDNFERAFWITCWEMLRRGKSWEEILRWCEDHGQGWRAVIMGKTGDSSDVLSTASWRKMCYLASQSSCSNEYEAAVYGLLGGNVKAVQKISRTVDDHLYAYYNAVLLRQFDQYLQKNWPDKITTNNGRGLVDDALQDSEHAQQAITDLVTRLRDKPATQHESIQPMKIIQSYLLANETESLINTVGYAISDEDARRGDEGTMMITHIRDLKALDEVMPETEVALDPHTLRILAHMTIILASLRSEPLEEGPERDAEENVIIAYMQRLREARKREPLLLYGSRLWRGKYITTLSRMLHDIPKSEQRDWLNLMTTGYNLDTRSIVSEHLLWLMNILNAGGPSGPGLHMLEPSQEKVHPKQRIKLDFIPDEMTEKELDLVKGLQWFVLMDGGWDTTFWALSAALQLCLARGRIACALEITKEYPYDEISKLKAYQTIKREINVMEHTVAGLHEEDELFRQIEWMKRRSRTYYELDQLVKVMETMALWADQEHPYIMQHPKPSAIPKELKVAKADVDDAMVPILNGILQSSTDPKEIAALENLRTQYLPEIILAYQVFLYTNGLIYTRDCFLDSMDLSVTVAKEENGIAAALISAGRMRELVNGFALASQTILVVKAQNSKPWKVKKDKDGRDPSLWEIGPQSAEGVEGGPQFNGVEST